jgi:hypothetical protein
LESHESLPEILVYLRQHQEDARPYPAEAGARYAADERVIAARRLVAQFLSLSVLEQVADASIQQTKTISYTQRPPTSTHYAGRASLVTCKVLPKRHSVKAIESLSMLQALPEMLRQQGRLKPKLEGARHLLSLRAFEKCPLGSTQLTEDDIADVRVDSLTE